MVPAKICGELHKGCRALIFLAESESHQLKQGDERQYHGGSFATRSNFQSFHTVEDDNVSTSVFVSK